jgi:hypothetical protein
MARRTQFSVDLSKAIKDVEGDIEVMIRKITLGLFNSIVLKTPVDTGHLAYNWQAGVDTPKVNELPGTDPDKTKVLSDGKANIDKWKLKNTSIWITNNVAYAEKIEYYGSPVKAPQGMVRVSLREFDSIFKGAALKGYKFL